MVAHGRIRPSKQLISTFGLGNQQQDKEKRYWRNCTLTCKNNDCSEVTLGIKFANFQGYKLKCKVSEWNFVLCVLIWFDLANNGKQRA